VHAGVQTQWSEDVASAVNDSAATAGDSSWEHDRSTDECATEAVNADDVHEVCS